MPHLILVSFPCRTPRPRASNVFLVSVACSFVAAPASSSIAKERHAPSAIQLFEFYGLGCVNDKASSPLKVVVFFFFEPAR